MKAYEGIYNRFIKRGIGFIVALPFLIIAIPIYIIISIAIVAEDGRPVFYRPLRGGYKNKPFRIFKFRTMVKNADKIGGGTTANHDPRITKVGGFLRKTKLDETANLINILIGTMSFIGPRPELLQYTEQYEGDEKQILEVRPGVTDYSSIEFINLDEIVGAGNADAHDPGGGAACRDQRPDGLPGGRGVPGRVVPERSRPCGGRSGCCQSSTGRRSLKYQPTELLSRHLDGPLGGLLFCVIILGFGSDG